jgi:hypothetical protein
METKNDKYYQAAVKAIENLKYYYDELKPGLIGYLMHYFPKAISDVFFGGCGPEFE